MTRLPGADFERVVDALFDAAVMPQLWPSALAGLAGALGAAGAIMIPKDPQKIELGFPTSAELSEVMDDFVTQGWHLRDIRADRGWPILASQKSIIVEHDLVSEEEHRSLPYFQELFAPYGMPWFGGIGFRVDGAQWCLTLIRGAGQGPYAPADLAPFAGLPRHLTRVVTLAYKVRAALDAPIVELSQLLGKASFLLGPDGRVLRASEDAHEALSPPLELREGRLTATAPMVDRELQAMIAGAVAAPSAAGQTTRGSISIPRPHGRPLILQALALPRIARDIFTSAVAVLFVRDPDREQARPDPAILAELFGLSAAEAKVAIAVGEGETPEAIARRGGVTISTVRNQLASVFAKCGVGRQSELAALMGRIPVSH